LAAAGGELLWRQLAKGSQKANWARRPLPEQMVKYAINDTRYSFCRWRSIGITVARTRSVRLVAAIVERAIEQAAVERVRDADESLAYPRVWRIAGPRGGGPCGHSGNGGEERKQWTGRRFHICRMTKLVRAAERFAAGTCLIIAFLTAPPACICDGRHRGHCNARREWRSCATTPWESARA